MSSTFQCHVRTVFEITALKLCCGCAAAPETNLVTDPQWSPQGRLFGGTVEIYCAAATHFKHDGIVQGTHITNTGMAGILFTWGKGLNKR